VPSGIWRSFSTKARSPSSMILRIAAFTVAAP
jgi:hypothetical protein